MQRNEQEAWGIVSAIERSLIWGLPGATNDHLRERLMDRLLFALGPQLRTIESNVAIARTEELERLDTHTLENHIRYRMANTMTMELARAGGLMQFTRRPDPWTKGGATIYTGTAAYFVPSQMCDFPLPTKEPAGEPAGS